MGTTDVLIIGGSVAGLAVANSVFNRWPEKKIQIIRNVEYAVIPCGIPYIYGLLDSVEKNLVGDRVFLSKGMSINQKHLLDVDRSQKIAFFEDGEQIAYDKLILALGSSPKMPPIKGIGLANVFAIKKDPVYLQTIYEALNAEGVKDVVVIGGGFIGVEMAEQVKMRGDFHVSIVEALPHCLMLNCEEFAAIKAEKELETLGIDVINSTMVQSISGDQKVESVILSDGRPIKADLVLLGIGSSPNIGIAEKLGLAVDPNMGIKVDEFMCTSDPSIYACGDCCTKFSALDGKPSDVRLASVAALEGILAGSNLFSLERKNQGVVGSFCSKVGSISVASTGYTEKQCQEKEIEYYTGFMKAPDRHPASLPDCTLDMEMKLIFEKGSNRVIGGHVVGGVQAGDMVNIIALAIHNRLTAEQIVATQYATHPLLTASPLLYHVLWAAEKAILNSN